MTALDFLLVGAVSLVLVTSIVMIIRRRGAELKVEREAAHSLQRMASAIQELQRELGAPSDDAQNRGSSNQSPAQISEEEPRAARSELERAVEDHEVLQVKLMVDTSSAYFSGSSRRLTQEWTRTAAERMLTANQAAGSVVDMWAYVTQDRGHGPTYTDVMGPTFDDALLHAARDGIMGHEEADVLREWAATTRAIERLPRGGKRTPAGEAPEIISIFGAEREVAG